MHRLFSWLLSVLCVGTLTFAEVALAGNEVRCEGRDFVTCSVGSDDGVRRVVVEQAKAGGTLLLIDTQVYACLPQTVVGWKAVGVDYGLTIVTCRSGETGRPPDVEEQIDLYSVRKAEAAGEVRVTRLDRRDPGALRRFVRIVSDTLPIALQSGGSPDQQALISHCGSPNAFCETGDGPVIAGGPCGIEDHQGQQSCPGTVETPPDEHGHPTGPYCVADC